MDLEEICLHQAAFGPPVGVVSGTSCGSHLVSFLTTTSGPSSPVYSTRISRGRGPSKNLGPIRNRRKERKRRGSGWVVLQALGSSPEFYKGKPAPRMLGSPRPLGSKASLLLGAGESLCFCCTSSSFFYSIRRCKF